MKKIEGRKFNKTRIARLLIVLLSILLVGVTGVLFVEAFKIDNVVVEGSNHYTADEIREYVIADWLSNNSIFLSLKYKNKSITDVPFIQRMDVSVVDNRTVKVMVYEKALAGYVEFLGNYMYFDKDGIVVECSSTKISGIPEVTGLFFDYVVLHEPLPVEKNTIFQDILDMTQLLNKYEICADRMHFDSNYEMTLYFGDVKTIIGDESNLDEKIMRLPYILPNLANKKGTLYLDGYNEGNTDIIFEED